jgi:TonB-dependent receptor
MLKFKCSFLLAAIAFVLFPSKPVEAQASTGTISGSVLDANQNVLPGAQVTLTRTNPPITANSRGEFIIPNVVPGDYTLTISYVGFSSQDTHVTVTAGQTTTMNVVLQVASQDTQIIVSGGRGYGEAEAVNEIRDSDTVLNILPSTVITSLPNANIADAVGRLPGVTLERDEGEGKYVQIRGTEPRLSNLTLNGVEVPSPEGTIRQVKLDIIPADIIESVQINKTMQANMLGDAIGGSVNVVMKTAGERPTLSFYGSEGVTPISGTVGTRPVAEYGATVGKRFADNRFGVLVSGTYDYNGRGINDIEPVPFGPTVGTFGTPVPPPDYSAQEIRLYKYNRNRFGVGVSSDYKLGASSLIYVRGLFSDFKDSGRRFDYVLNNNETAVVNAGNGGPPSFNTEIRSGHFQVASIVLGGNHVYGAKYYFDWEAAISRSRMFNPINGGESIDTFSYTPQAASNCQFSPALTTDVYRPQWAPICYTEAYNPSNFQLTTIEQASHGQSSQLNLEGQVSGGRIYNVGPHIGQLEIGFRYRTLHKFDDSFENFFAPDPALNLNLPINMFLSGVSSKNYYFGSYPLGPLASWDKINKYFAANPGNFIQDPNNPSNTYGTNPANFDLVERVASGYVMNTFSFSRFKLIAGIRFEGTSFYSYSVNTTTINPCNGLCVKASGSYIDPLPSASLRMSLTTNSDIRVVYSRTLSRPLPGQLTTAVSEDTSTAPSTFVVGAVLNPEHSNNYDVLYERYLTPLGLIQGGFFYKQISNPIVTDVTFCPSVGCTTPQFAGHFVSRNVNAGSAYVAGVELAFQQHFSYLPGLFRGLGVLANYAYTTSGTTRVNPLRTDNPALLRQAPTTWNISPTYDIGRLSLRVGLAYNGANIFQYFYQDLAAAPNPTPPPATITVPNPQPGGAKGPFGDQYLYAHFQVDAQGSYRIGKGWTFIASALNLNNEVFGFYNGSPQFVLQREYYWPTYSFGFRWDFTGESLENPSRLP